MNKNIKSIFFQNILLFLLLSITVSVATTYINYNSQFKVEEEKIKQQVFFESNLIKSEIKKYLNKVENGINAIQTNKLFIDYLLQDNLTTKENSKNLFLNTMKNNTNFFQFRFIDKDGMEKIRIDRKRFSNDLFIVADDELQNKSERYYFKETINIKTGKYWYSLIDLNIEKGVIEEPIRPTYRVSTNVFYKGEFYGILIANIEIKNLLETIKKNNEFYVYLIDEEENFITHPDKSKEWNKYLSNDFKLKNEFPNFSEDIKNQTIFQFSLNEYFKNNENIHLILKVKNEYLAQIEANNLSSAFKILIILLFISIPIGIFFSIPSSRLYLKINQLNKENFRYLDTVDKYVITISVDINKKITDVSKALCDLSGYSKEELLGQNPSIFKSGKVDVKVYKELWNKITSGSVWYGEVQNKTKSGQMYWLKTTILPDLSEKGEITGYTSLSEDITDKKAIEKISQTDKLTQLCNRVKLDKTLEHEMSVLARYKKAFSVVLIDIDKFKAVNDNYGHQVGDSVLIELSNLLQTYSRKTDIVGRWGGEEFMIVCSYTEIRGAYKFAENLRVIVENHTFKYVGKKTISVGVTQAQLTDTIELMIKRVDDYLYKAKNQGRNIVISDQ